MVFTILLVFAVAVFIFTIIMFLSGYESPNKKAENEARIRQRRKKNEEKKENYNKALNELISKYGDPTKTLKAKLFEKHNLETEIIAFEESEMVWICGKLMPMKSILNCTLEDKQRIERREASTTSKTKSGNMAKRAVVGSVLMGPAGAVIGGATAKKQTVTKGGGDRIRHNYTVVINVDSMSDPIIRINMGRHGKSASEIVGLMNVIVNRNNRRDLSG